MWTALRVLPILIALNDAGTTGVAEGTNVPKEFDAKGEQFGKRIEGILSSTTYLQEVDDELFSDKRMQEVLARPERFRSEVESYLKGHPSAAETRIRIAILGMQCLKLDDYLQFVETLSAAERGRMSRWALFYSVVPGFEWSTRLALGYRDGRIRRTLESVSRSANSDEKIRLAIGSILDGTASRAITMHKTIPTLRCK